MEQNQVETAEAMDVAEETSEQASMEPTRKTFSESDVDAIVKKRIDKQNAKHASELEALNKRIAELEESNAKATAERDELQRGKDVADWAAKASEETGVPADLIRGNDADEMMAHAKALAERLGKPSSYPFVRDSGNGTEAVKKSSASTVNQFADFMREHFNN